VKQIINSNIINALKKDKDIWELFTKKEEYNPIKLDSEDRFRYEYSRHKDVLNPIVSEYLLKQGFNVRYPDNKKFSVVLTHDVDDIYVKTSHIFRSFPNCIRYRNFKNIKSLVNGKINKEKSPYINFQKIIDLEEKYHAKSTFYFLVKPDSDFGNNYFAKDMEDELNKILDRNCEIGYHTRYNVYDKLDEIISEKKALEQIIGEKVIGARNHHLRFKTPDTWNILSKAGFAYDSSFHYNDMIGFRNGMAHPYNPYDLNNQKSIDILEIPLIISDIAFKSFMKLNPRKNWEYIKKTIDVIEKNNGVLTILWHSWTFSLPISISGWFGKDWTKLYEKILNYCKEKNAWLTNCNQLYSYNEKIGIFSQN
jgi:peptidoglycan/xylan/chitin deacetylase (PgdA/CDA1 family)